MDIKELLDDEAFDPKKLFDGEEYSTLIINREGFNKKQNEAADLLETLLDKKTTRAESEEIFKQLKETKSQALMVDAISVAERSEEKTILTAACWECGLDFTPYLLQFVELVSHDHFPLAMEALTVVTESCNETVDENTLHQAINLADNSKSQHNTLTADLLTQLRSRIIS